MNHTNKKAARVLPTPDAAQDTSQKHSTTGPQRVGRGKAHSTMVLIDAAIRILKEIQPATVRAVCYRLFIEKLIPSMSKGETGKISKHLVWARENGQLPWAWVVDETRQAEHVASWASPEAIIRTAVAQYRKDYWTMQPRWVEVWSEKGTIRGTLAPVLKKYGVSFRVMHGYGSATAIHAIAQETVGSEKPLTALYIGDWDPSGMAMSQIDLPDRLQRYGGTATIMRVALAALDVRHDTKLPYFEAASKAQGSRYDWFVEHYGPRCWEVDALSPVILRQRVENQILTLLDRDAWNHAVGIEQAETESMKSLLTTWKSISSQGAKYSKGVKP